MPRIDVSTSPLTPFSEVAARLAATTAAAFIAVFAALHVPTDESAGRPALHRP
jgi:hypothetical protein